MAILSIVEGAKRFDLTGTNDCEIPWDWEGGPGTRKVDKRQGYL